MKQYRVVGKLARISTGNVELTPEQASDRMHNLKKLGGDVYEVLKPIEFKAGQVFGYDGTPGKGQASIVEEETPPESEPTEKKEKPKAEAKPKK